MVNGLRYFGKQHNMRLQQYITEAIKSRLIKGVYGKVRTIEGYKNYNKLYVFKKKVPGQGSSYMVSDSEKVSMDSMIEINGEFWFSTLKELHGALNK